MKVCLEVRRDCLMKTKEVSSVAVGRSVRVVQSWVMLEAVSLVIPGVTLMET